MGVESSKLSKPPKPMKHMKLSVKGGGEKGKPVDISSAYDPSLQSERENLSAWHREGVSVWDVYELVEVIGQGHMGEVYKVRRKKEVRGLHNKETRGRQAEVEKEKELAAEREGKKERSRSRSKSPFRGRKKKGALKKKLKKRKDKMKGKDKKKGGGGGDLPRPDPQVVPVKKPQAPAQAPSKGILKHSKFVGEKKDEREEKELYESDIDEASSEEEEASEEEEGESSSDQIEQAPEEKKVDENDGNRDDDDDDEGEEVESNAEYMKKWQERIKVAKEERLKLLEKMESSASDLPASEASFAASSTPDGSRHDGAVSDGGGDAAAAVAAGGAVAPVAPASPRTGGKKKIRFQRLYACKTVLTSHVKAGYVDQLLNEIAIMKNLDHPFILQLFEVYHVKRSIWLVTELCTGGDLTSRKLTEPQVALVLEQILRALTYLHRLGICHRDIKLENILYENGGKEATIRLIDFGLSQAFDRAADMKRRAVGTAYTMSPEIASGEGTYTKSTDLWALGVVAWILLAGDAPFLKEAEELKDKDKLNKLLGAKYTFGITWKGRGISKYGYDFVRRSLKRRPGDRWTAKEALDYVQGTWIPELEGDYEGKEEARKLERLSIASRRRSGAAADINVEDVNRFCNYGRLKKTILMTMARTMERSEVDRLREIFLTADTEDRGTITLVELRTSIKQCNSSMSDEDIEKMFSGMDQDRSGQIHWAEFLAALSESHGLITMDRLATVFDRLDAEGKGYISHENLKVILGKDYDREVVEGMIREADFKRNGQIDYEEFLQLMFADPESGDVAVGRIDDSLETLRGLSVQ